MCAHLPAQLPRRGTQDHFSTEPPLSGKCPRSFLLGPNLSVRVRTAIASGLSGIFSRGTAILGFCVGSVWDCFGHAKRQHLSYLETTAEVSPWLYKVSRVRIVYCGQSDNLAGCRKPN